MDWGIPFKVLVMEKANGHEYSKLEALLVSKGYEYIRRQRGNVIWALRTFKPVSPPKQGNPQ